MRTFRGITVALAAGTAAVGLLAGCGSSDDKGDKAGNPPTTAPTSGAKGSCPSDDTILGYAKNANNGALPGGAKVVSKTCEVGWIVAKIASPGADQATLVSQNDGSHAVLGTSICENAADFPAQIKAVLHC